MQLFDILWWRDHTNLSLFIIYYLLDALKITLGFSRIISTYLDIFGRSSLGSYYFIIRKNPFSTSAITYSIILFSLLLPAFLQFWMILEAY